MVCPRKHDYTNNAEAFVCFQVSRKTIFGIYLIDPKSDFSQQYLILRSTTFVSSFQLIYFSLISPIHYFIIHPYIYVKFKDRICKV